MWQYDVMTRSAPIGQFKSEHARILGFCLAEKGWHVKTTYTSFNVVNGQ